MEISDEKEKEMAVVTVSGRLDAGGAQELESYCKSLIESGSKKLLVDMAGVEYLSSVGLRSLLVMSKMIKAVEGKLVLCSLNPMVRQVIELSGLDQILALIDDHAKE